MFAINSNVFTLSVAIAAGAGGKRMRSRSFSVVFVERGSLERVLAIACGECSGRKH